jgi:cobalt/nickel transport protein
MIACAALFSWKLAKTAMKYLRQLVLLAGIQAVWTNALYAHYSMLFPESATARPGQPVTILFQWGHPFEHQLANAPPPTSLTVLSPSGKKAELTKALQEVALLPGAKGGSIRAFRLRFAPDERGDYIFILHGSPIWMDEDRAFFQDTVHVVLHVQAQKGWDNSVGKGLEMMPLTRPYGLQPGMVFQARVLADGKALTGAMVEVERYNASPPSILPPDEHITRTAKTDPGGVATVSLTEPGWWGLTAAREGGKKEHDGKTYPVRERVTLWVHVDDPKAIPSTTSK